MTRTKEAWLKFIATRIVGIIVDAFIVGVAYLSAFILRFDFGEPVSIGGWSAVAKSYVVVAAVYLIALLLLGCYRYAWRRINFGELPRYALAAMLACIVLTLMRYFMPNVTLSHIRPPYSITVICFFLSFAGIVSVRYLWRFYNAFGRKESELLSRDEKTFDNSIALVRIM